MATHSGLSELQLVILLLLYREDDVSLSMDQIPYIANLPELRRLGYLDYIERGKAEEVQVFLTDMGVSLACAMTRLSMPQMRWETVLCE